MLFDEKICRRIISWLATTNGANYIHEGFEHIITENKNVTERSVS